MLMTILRIIPHPFANFIRYGALKMMKKMRMPRDQRPVIAASDHLLNEIVMPSVFAYFKEDSFRELADFKKLPGCEHDRIFNELEIAGICAAIFYLRAAKSLVKPEDYHFWQDTEIYLPEQLQKTLLNIGIDDANAKLMRELVEMRKKEYEELKNEVWDNNLNNNSKFKTLPPELKQTVAAIQTTAVGTANHIRRGKIKEGDQLIKHLTTWLFALQQCIGKFVRHL